MLSNHFVIQKITNDSQVMLYQAHTENLVWHFESNTSPNNTNGKEYFPFVFDESIRVNSSRAGSETSAFVRNQKYVVFNDKYAVPSGIVIGILFPEGFAPTVFKFVERPTIPVGVPRNTSVSPPGYFDVFYNRNTRQSAIVFMIGSPSYFEFKCLARYWNEGFPEQEFSSSGNDTLHLTLNPENIGKTHISTNDLLNFSSYFKEGANLETIQKDINRLIDIVENNNRAENKDELSALKKSLGSMIFVTEFSSAIVQLMDSYYGGGVVHKIIAKVLTYLIM